MRLYRKTSIGSKFGKLTITAVSDEPDFVHCICECGTVCEKRFPNMTRGMCNSCGCTKFTCGGASVDPELRSTHVSWSKMHDRCKNSKHPSFHNYGGRGISVCPQWESFDGFLADMGKRPAKTTLDRKDTNGNYCPDNCQWSTKSTQDNNRRTNRFVILDGVRMTFVNAFRRMNKSIWKGVYLIRNKGFTHQQAIDAISEE